MQAVVLDRFGEPGEALEVRDVPKPTCGAGEVLVRMLASPINPSDLMMIRGRYGLLPNLPATPGFEGVGVVESAGSGLLGRLLVGRRVAVLNSATGNWREWTTIPARQAVPLPGSLPLEQAAMFFVNPATAYVLCRQVLKIPTGETLVQTAAGSALAGMVRGLAGQHGFRTINVVRRKEQADALRAAGELAVDGETQSITEEVRRLAGPAGVRYAIDCVGGEVASALVPTLGLGGRLILFGTLSGEPMRFEPRDIMTPSAKVEGFWLARWMERLSLLGKIRLMRKVAGLLRAGTVQSPVAARFPLTEIRAAVVAAEQPGRSGKILLDIASST